jgi:hypothetical protein
VKGFGFSNRGAGSRKGSGSAYVSETTRKAGGRSVVWSIDRREIDTSTGRAREAERASTGSR